MVFCLLLSSIEMADVPLKLLPTKNQTNDKAYADRFVDECGDNCCTDGCFDW